MELKIACALFYTIGILAIVGMFTSLVLIIKAYLYYQKEQKKEKAEMITLIDFIDMYSGKENDYTKVVFEWYWTDTGIDEEYCFEGKPSEFYEKYTKDYKIIEGVYMNDLTDLSIKKDGRIEIYAKVVQD